MKHHIPRCTVALVAMLMLLALVAGPVSAKTVNFSFSYESSETDTSCGFSVDRYDVGTAKGRVSDGRFDITNKGVATLTNPDNDLYVTQEYNILFKNRNSVTNSDGSRTVENKSVGPSTIYDSNGKVLLRNHGPITNRLTFDADGNFVSQEVVFEHGAHDGYCETLEAALDF